MRGLRGAAWTAAAIVLLGMLSWLALPPLLRWQGETRLTALLGRPVTIGHVGFAPWKFELTLDDLRVGAAGANGAPLLTLAHLRADLAPATLWRLHPIVSALEIDSPQVQMARLAPGHYDIDDLIARFTPAPNAAPSEPTRFALHNLELRDGSLRLDDRPAGRVHRMEAIALALPFISNLVDDVDTPTQPHLAFKLDGASFDSGAAATPFAATDKGSLHLVANGVDLAAYLPYWPASLPLRLQRGTLAADLSLHFELPPGATPVASLQGGVELRDLALADSAGAPLVSWSRLQLGLRDLQPLARKLAFGKLAIEGAQVHLQRDAAGRLVLPAFAPASAPAPAASAPAKPWQASLDALAISGASVFWNDASTRPAAALRLDELSASAQDIAWPLAKPVALTLDATLHTAGAAAAGHLSAQGSAMLDRAQAQLTLADLDLGALAPYAAQALVPRLDGHLSAKVTADWATEPQKLQIAVEQATLDSARLASPANASLAKLSVSGAQVDLGAHSVSVDKIELQRPQLAVARDKQGRIDAAAWLRGAPAAAPAAKPAAAGPEWHLQLHQAAIDGGRIGFSDAAAGAAPVHLSVHDLKLALAGFDWSGSRPGAPAHLKLSARIDDGKAGAAGAPLSFDGSVGARPLLAKGRLKLQGLPATLFTPYFADSLPLALLSADAGYDGSVSLHEQGGGYAVDTGGDVRVGNLHVASKHGSGDELLGWQALALDRLHFTLAPGARPRLDIGAVTLTDLYARLLVTEQGRFNLSDVGADAPAAAVGAASAPAVAAAPAAAPASAASSAPALPLDISVGGTKLVDGRVDFTDHFVRPNYSAALTELNGTLGAFNSASREMAPLQLSGRAEGTALLDVSGLVNPLVHPLALDIKAKASDLELAPLSPYAAKYAGYGIERGKLSMNVAYKIDAEGHLVASNQVILNQLTFGDKVDSPDATKLPVRLAVALLKDRNGVIDLDLPISGTLDDPQFSIGGIVIKLIVNLIVKAITSPFALLGGGGSQDLGRVVFAPGSAAIDGSAAASVDKVAQALAERPALQMTITGDADTQAEHDAYQRSVIESRLAAARHRAALAAGAAASAPALTPAEHEQLLEQLYAQAKIPDKPRNFIGLAKDIPPEQMEALLARQVPVSDDALKTLALQRATAVRDALIAKGVASSRLFLAAPQLHQGDAAGWTPHAKLELSAP